MRRNLQVDALHELCERIPHALARRIATILHHHVPVGRNDPGSQFRATDVDGEVSLRQLLFATHFVAQLLGIFTSSTQHRSHIAHANLADGS